MEYNQRKATELLEDGYDLHVHSAPSHIKRILDDVEVLQQASEAKMAGILIKNHYESTAARAALLNKRSGLATRAYGGIVLNWPAGGLNPYAAESALKLGGSFVWLPTRDAANCLTYGNMPGDFFDRPGISILDENEKLLPAVYEVLEVVRRYNAVFATGHVSPRESVIVCKAARQMGVRTVLTHPEWERTVISGEVQAQLAELGVMIEKDWINVADGTCSIETMMRNIRLVGCEHVFIATDRGQMGKETPREGMLHFIELLLEQGFSDREIKTMVHSVPQSLLA
ncbi:DUF6282 family protein [Faecalispora anaeroviscerum]|uniref:DUF6282 family protein n=1 Tax=Faecalispora anaeroviscerum TaxID=2991836 RepID=UPI0024B955F9|nr:DUF6282 family protein [Faecalispora anaeroviscerum]